MQTNTVQKSRLSTITLALIPLAIVLNIVVGQITDSLTLPVFLDSIGTMLIAILAGPWVAALTGLLTNLIWGLITGPTAAAFAPVMIVIGLVTGILAKAGWFKKWWQVIISGALIGIAASITAVPIRVYLFGGVTGSGADFITAYLLATGRDLFGSVIITVLASNIPDKIVTALLAWLIVKALPGRFAARFPMSKSVQAE